MNPTVILILIRFRGKVPNNMENVQEKEDNIMTVCLFPAIKISIPAFW